MTMNLKKVFTSFNHRLVFVPAIVRAFFIQEFDQNRTFLLNKKIPQTISDLGDLHPLGIS